MSIEDGDKNLDSNSGKAVPPPEAAVREADEGKSGFVSDHKQYVADIKSGVLRSGITNEFGKQVIFDSKNQKEHGRDFGKTAERMKLKVDSPDGDKAEKLAPYLEKAVNMVKDATKLGDLNFAGKTGITSEFGKPFMFDSEELKGAKSAGKAGHDKAKDPQPVDKDIAQNTELGSSLDHLAKQVPAESITNGLKLPADKSAGKQVETQESPEMQKLKDAKLPLSPEQEAQLRKDMDEINKLPEDQRKKVLESLDKIANADTKDTTKLDPKQRAELLASLAHQVAHPESIKQGAKDTCVSANVEKTLAMTHPDQYAEMTAQLATKGEYTTPDGKTTVKAQREADGKLADTSDPSGQRSATSEMMQTAITNLGMPEGETYKSYKPGKEPIPDGVIKAEDSGERVVGADGKEKRFEGLKRDAKEDILGKLVPNEGYQARRVQSTEDLGQAWKDNGGKPPLHATVRINAEHTGMGQAKDGAAGTHAVVITHMEFGPDGKPTKVYYENTADSTDHSYPNGKPVDADEFVKSMQNERSHTYKDGSTDRWSEPMTVTVRTDGDQNRSSKVDAEKSKDLDKAVEEFRDSTHKDAIIDYGTDLEKMQKTMQGRPRWEIEEINKRYKEKYGKSLDEEIIDETSGKDKIRTRQLLKGTDTQVEAPPPQR